MQKITIADRYETKAKSKKAIFLLAGILLLSVSIAGAESSARKADPSANEPKRSYGSIDVIMYQTSW
jgi:hypothetical protein